MSGRHIVEVAGLQVSGPKALQQQVNPLALLVGMGLFMVKGMAVCLSETPTVVKVL